MALTGLQIQKLLPKTNCKECGVNTCLAFAMKLAARKAEIADCPYASEEAIALLSEAYEPPVKGVQLGPYKALRLGEETVLYRHEKSFVNQTLLAVNVNDTDESTEIDATLLAVKDYAIERVGETIGLDMVAVSHRGPSVDAFVELAKRAWSEVGKPLVLRSHDPDALGAAAKAVAEEVHKVQDEKLSELRESLLDDGKVLELISSKFDSDHQPVVAAVQKELKELAEKVDAADAALKEQQQKLEEELSRAEARWGQDRFESLRLAAQNLAAVAP